MGRVFFPTYRANIIGVREVGPQTQLGGMDGSIVIPRAPAEPYPRAANNPTGRMLGAVATSQLIDRGVFVNGGPSPMPVPMPVWGPLPIRCAADYFGSAAISGCRGSRSSGIAAAASSRAAGELAKFTYARGHHANAAADRRDSGFERRRNRGAVDGTDHHSNR